MNKGYKESGITSQRFNLKVLTPTFIGGNVENNLIKSQYIFNPKAQNVIIIDEKKFINFLYQRKLTRSYLSFIELNNKKRNPEPLNTWFKKEKITDEIGDLMKRVVSSKNVDGKTMNDIHCFQKDIYGNPFIPGSSIKGGFRTAIACHIISKRQKEFNRQRNALRDLFIEKAYANAREQKNKLKRINREMEEQLFTYPLDRKTKIKSMAGLSVGDTFPFRVEDLCLVQKEDYSHGKDDPFRMPVFRECLKPKSQTTFSINYDILKSDQKLEYEEPLDILEALDTMSELLIGKDGVFRAFKELNTFLPQWDETAGLLFLGGGAGFHTKTWLIAMFDDPDERLLVMRNIMELQFPRKRHLSDHPISPRTLKLATYDQKKYLMGLCELSQVDEC